MYNIKYGEKIIEKFDVNVAKKQKKARTDSLNKLEGEINESRKKNQRYQETSDDNVEELISLKKGAQDKLRTARSDRKKLTVSMKTIIQDAVDALKVRVYK